MANYTWSPSADESGQETLHAWWQNGFSIDELTQIIKIGDSKIPNDATVGTDEEVVNNDIRKSKVSWLDYNDLPWLYDRLAWIGRKLNGQYFQYDVSGFYENLQYTVYNSNDQGYYGWHMDKGYSSNSYPPRKLSLVLILSHPDEYEGGELQLQTGNGTMIAQKEQGIVHAFPSFLLHQVTPVTKGTRRSLVCWTGGNRWR